jgi:hypothetical protein
MHSLIPFYRAMSDVSRDAANVARSPTPQATEKMRDSLERAIETVDDLKRDAQATQKRTHN